MSGNEGTQPTNNTINAIASEDAGYELNEGVKQIPLHPERFITHPVLPGIAPIPMLPEWREPTTQNNLYIKNISDSVTEETLKSIFAPHGELVSVKIMTNEKGESKGFGFVCFSKSADAFKAKLALHGYMLEKKPLYVSFAQKKEERQKQLQQFHTVGYPIHPPPPYAAYTPMVNFPPDFYPPPPRQPPLIPYQAQPQGPPITYLGNLSDLPPPHFPPQLAPSSAPPGSKSPNPSNGNNSSKGPSGPRRGQYSSPSSRGNPASNNGGSGHPYNHGNGHHSSYKGSGNSRNYKGNPNNPRRDYPPPPDHGGYPPLLIPSPYPPSDPNLLSHPPPHLHHPPTPDNQ